MPPSPKFPSEVRGNKGTYRITELIDEGNVSWSLKAEDVDTGKAVFLKYYKSPTPTVSWYHDYLEYVGELNQKLVDSAAAQYCALPRDLFAANPCPEFSSGDYLFSAYEFIGGGYDLRKLMDAPEGMPWEKRKEAAKVFLSAMKEVHGAGVVHCDLKPDNVQMLPLEGPAPGLVPCITGLDFSILESKQAPWATGGDEQGYTGTPGYFSPEHLGGATPTKASDVFTIGLILGELLGGRHPFAESLDDGETYRQSVQASRYTPVKLLGPLGGKEENAEQYARLIERCFLAGGAERPTCEQLHAELLALDADASTETASTETPFHLPGVPVAPPSGERPVARQYTVLRLTGDLGSCDVRISTAIGKGQLSAISRDAGRYAATEQFLLERRNDVWYISPTPNSVGSATGLNGELLAEETELKDGDEIHLIGKTSGAKAMFIKVAMVK